MKLHEIISINDGGENRSVLIELLIPYKKSLLKYYECLFCCEPILMVTSVSNAAQYGRIVPSNEFIEALYIYVDSMGINNKDEREGAEEVISFNSISLTNI